MEGVNDILAKLQAEKTRLEAQKERLDRESQRVQEELRRVSTALLALQGEATAPGKQTTPTKPASGTGQRRGRPPGSKLPPEVKAKMAAAQKARWAAIKEARADKLKP